MLTSNDVFNRAKRWVNVEVLHDKNGDFQTTFYNISEPLIFFMNDHQQVIHTQNTNKLEVVKAYKLADQLKQNLIKPEKIYFDKDWFPVPEAEGLYYSMLQRNGDNDWDITDYYKNGQVQMQGKLIIPYPQVRIGKFSYYYQTGKLESVCFYDNNLLTGQAIGWHENGNLKYDYNYVDGNFDGEWTTYYDNGKTLNTGVYINGKATGTWYHYYANGNKWKEALWRDGLLNGRSQAWYGNGKLKFDVVFKDDELQLHTPKPQYYYANGNSAYEEKSPTSFAYFFENGKTYLTIELVNDLLELNLFHENGKPSYRVTMSDQATVNGKYIVWHNNGNKQAEATLFDNIPTGRAMAWWENGNVRERVDYNNNTKEYFDQQGNKLSAAPKDVYIVLSKGEQIDTRPLTDSINWLVLTILSEGRYAE